MEMILANGKRVKVSLGEVQEFITQMFTPIPNAYWRYSELLTENEVMTFLRGESTKEDLQKIARYLLIYTENLSFTVYLFGKADGEAERTKEFNMPAIKKLRELYQKVTDGTHQAVDTSQTVHEMENTCLGIGADPL